jgi:PPP5 TPR repeat region
VCVCVCVCVCVRACVCVYILNAISLNPHQQWHFLTACATTCIVIASDYKGLILEFPLTLIQVKEMMERFHNQEKIHVKNLYEILRATQAHLRSLRPLVDVAIPENGTITV